MVKLLASWPKNLDRWLLDLKQVEDLCKMKINICINRYLFINLDRINTFVSLENG